MFGHPHTDSFKPLGEQLLEIKEDRHVVIDPPADVFDGGSFCTDRSPVGAYLAYEPAGGAECRSGQHCPFSTACRKSYTTGGNSQHADGNSYGRQSNC